MSGCHNPDCEHAEEKKRVNFCIMCNQPFPKCECMWKAIRQLDEKINELQKRLDGLGTSTAEILSKHVARIEMLEKKVSVIGNSYVDNMNELKTNVSHISQAMNLMYVQCKKCEGKGKVLMEDLTPAAQGEADRWLVVDCPECQGKGKRGFLKSKKGEV